MSVRARYTLYFIIVIVLSTVVSGIMTNAKYYSSVDMESSVSIGAMVFTIKQDDGEPNPYELTKGGQITAKYKLTNKDSNDNINKMDLKYYLKVVDGNGSETLPVGVSLDGYSYIQVQQNDVVTDKGFGEITLSYDGETYEEEELNINISCPEDYSGDENLNYSVKIIAEQISTGETVIEETVGLNIHINEVEETPNNEILNESNVENTVNETNANVVENSVNETNIVNATNTNTVENETNNETEDNNTVVENVISPENNENNVVSNETVDELQEKEEDTNSVDTNTI